MKRVLVIDDDRDILSAVELALETNGFDVAISKTASNILQIVQNFEPDLIILDYLLSGDDGSIVCADLKQSPQTMDIPVILFSANPSAQQRVPQCGASSFLSKPFSIADLVDTVNRHMANPRHA